MTPAGLFVTFEGGEGAGKSTQLDRLKVRLEAAGRDVVATREPGGTPLGEAVRSVLLHADAGPTCPRSELCLYLASRAELTHAVIRPALARGAVVLCDRYADASVAYQGGGRELGVEAVVRMNAFATGGLEPDVTVLLDVSPEVGLERVRRRGGLDRLEREARAFHERVRDTYRALAAAPRFLRLDAGASPDALAEAIWTAVRAKL